MWSQLSILPSAVRKCRSEARLLHQPVSACTLGRNYPSSFLFSSWLSAFLSTCETTTMTTTTTCYTYTLPILNSFVCLAFPSRELVPDLHQPISDMHLTRLVQVHAACSRLTATKFFLFSRWISCSLFLVRDKFFFAEHLRVICTWTNMFLVFGIPLSVRKIFSKEW